MPRLFQDFERYGVFDAQSALEKLQKQEEDELYAQMSDERRRQTGRLQRFVEGEKLKTVEELIYWFTRRGSSQQDIDEGLQKVAHPVPSLRPLSARWSLLNVHNIIGEKSIRTLCCKISKLLDKSSHGYL